MMTMSQEKGIGNHILKYGPIYLFVGSLIVNWALTTASIQQLDYRVTKVEAEQESTRDVLMEIRLDVGNIKKDIDYIKKAI